VVHRPPVDSPETDDAAVRRLFDSHADAQQERRIFEQLGLGGNPELQDDYWVDFYNIVVDGDDEAAEALALVLRLCHLAQDDDMLSWIGVQFVEPLLDLHWRNIGEDFYAAASKDRAVRKALSCAWLALKPARRGGRDMEQRLLALTACTDDVAQSQGD
jgi:hypothetical protein